MKQLIARRGAVPRYVLTEGPWEEMDTWIEDAVTDLKWEDIVSAIPGSARASHRIAAIHPTRWQEGDLSLHPTLRLLQCFGCRSCCSHFVLLDWSAFVQ